MLVRFLLLCLLAMLVARAIRRFLAGVVQGATRPGGGPPEQGVRMIRDPVCGTFVVPSRAITAGSGAEVRYFCSIKCRDAYRARSASR